MMDAPARKKVKGQNTCQSRIFFVRTASARIPSRHHVVTGAFAFDAKRAGHVLNLWGRGQCANQHAASGHDELGIEYAERARLMATEERRSEMEFLTQHLMERDTGKVNLMDVLVASGCDTITQAGP